MTMSTNTTINYHAEIDKMFDSVKNALASGSASSYELPLQLRSEGASAELRVAADDDALIAAFLNERKSAAHAIVTQTALEIEGIFQNGGGNSQANHDKLDALFNLNKKQLDDYLET